MEKNEPKFIRGKYTPAAKEATKRYQQKTYDDIRFRVYKGEKQKIQDAAAKLNMSMNAFITEAVARMIDELEKEENKDSDNNSDT